MECRTPSKLYGINIFKIIRWFVSIFFVYWMDNGFACHPISPNLTQSHAIPSPSFVFWNTKFTLDPICWSHISLIYPIRSNKFYFIFILITSNVQSKAFGLWIYACMLYAVTEKKKRVKKWILNSRNNAHCTWSRTIMQRINGERIMMNQYSVNWSACASMTHIPKKKKKRDEETVCWRFNIRNKDLNQKKKKKKPFHKPEKNGISHVNQGESSSHRIVLCLKNIKWPITIRMVYVLSTKTLDKKRIYPQPNHRKKEKQR